MGKGVRKGLSYLKPAHMLPRNGSTPALGVSFNKFLKTFNGILLSGNFHPHDSQVVISEKVLRVYCLRLIDISFYSLKVF